MEDIVGSIITVVIFAAIGLGLLRPVLRAGTGGRRRRSPVYDSTSPRGPDAYIRSTTVPSQQTEEEPFLFLEAPTWAQPVLSRDETESEADLEEEKAPLPAPPWTEARPAPRRAIARLFHSGRSGLRLAILSQEVLGPPKALRPTDGD